VQVVGREMQNISLGYYPLLTADSELNPALHHKRYLLMRMSVLGRYDEGIEGKSAHHDLLTDDHLPFDPFAYGFGFDLAPIGDQC
jgi:hypothetical protein